MWRGFEEEQGPAGPFYTHMCMCAYKVFKNEESVVFLMWSLYVNK